MREDDNPYRFVEAGETDGRREAETDAMHGGWDVRDYLAPEDEPVFSPEEIARLGRRWSGFTLATIMGLIILVLLGCLTLPATTSGTPPASTFRFDLSVSLIYLPILLGFQMLLGGGAYRLSRALRHSRPRAATIGAFYVVPILGSALLVVLGYQAIMTLRRHGIPCDFMDSNADSLPRPIRGRGR